MRGVFLLKSVVVLLEAVVLLPVINTLNTVVDEVDSKGHGVVCEFKSVGSAVVFDVMKTGDGVAGYSVKSPISEVFGLSGGNVLSIEDVVSKVVDWFATVVGSIVVLMEVPLMIPLIKVELVS